VISAKIKEDIKRYVKGQKGKTNELIEYIALAFTLPRRVVDIIVEEIKEEEEKITEIEIF